MISVMTECKNRVMEFSQHICNNGVSNLGPDLKSFSINWKSTAQ